MRNVTHVVLCASAQKLLGLELTPVFKPCLH